MWRVLLVTVALLVTSGWATACQESPPKTPEEAKQRKADAAKEEARKEAEFKAAMEQIVREAEVALKGAKTKEQADEIKKQMQEKVRAVHQRRHEVAACA